jgi:hypothetical protein
MAGLVDLLLATVVAVALGGVSYLFGLLVGIGNLFEGNNNLGWLAFSVYVVGAIVLIARRGRTPGQALFELEVVDVTTGRPPALPRAALRVVLPILVPLIEMITSFVLERLGYQLYHWLDGILTAFFLVPPIGLLWAAMRSVSKQTFWDRRSSTVVRYRMRRQTV